MPTTLITNATVVFPNDTRPANILIDGTTIADIDAAGDTPADTIIDATGLHLIPGCIDDQVHFRDPGLTHKEDLRTGSFAAAKGGVTSFLEMPNTNPTTTSVQALHDKLDLAASKCITNYGFYIGATPDNVDELVQAKRTPGIKIFIGSSTGNLLVDEQAALEKIFAETTLPITAHCEDETTVRANAAALDGGKTIHDHSRIRNHEAAVIATKRAIDLANRHKHRFHVLHVSTADEARLLADAGPYISAEACPHHLFFNVNDYDRLGSLVQMNPSIKNETDNAELWRALHDGRIQVVATDHAPHTLEEKDQPYPQSPSGLPAVENSLALMLNEVHSGHCELEEVVHWMCDAPARVWDIVNKGRIEVGYDADLTLVDLGRELTIRNGEQATKSGWSPWDGVTLTGWPVRTIVMGSEVFRRNDDGSCWFDEDFRGSEVQFDHSRGGFFGVEG